MRISDNELKKLLVSDYAVVEDATPGTQTESLEAVESQLANDREMIQAITTEVLAMPDRDAMVAELKARIEAGEYNPSGSEIADAMIRRSIADRIR